MSGANESALIEIEGLTKRFGAFTAVDDVSFTVDRGEVLGFLGPNGAGKSTTMRMLAGFMTPTAGTARICGHDVRTEASRQRSVLGFLPEGAPTYPEMTVTGFLRFCAKIRGYRGTELADRVQHAIGPDPAARRAAAADGDAVQGLQAPRRPGAGAAARSARAGAGRADRWPGPQPEARGPRT